MAGDLEDFLKRAAARRLAKAEEAKQPGQNPAGAPNRKPEYTDRNRERVVRPVDETPVVAEVIEESVDPLAERRRKLEEAKKRAQQAQERLSRESKTKSSRTEKENASQSASAAQELVRALQTPAGVRQAILLREILERPDFNRWD